MIYVELLGLNKEQVRLVRFSLKISYKSKEKLVEDIYLVLEKLKFGPSVLRLSSLPSEKSFPVTIKNTDWELYVKIGTLIASILTLVLINKGC